MHCNSWIGIRLDGSDSASAVLTARLTRLRAPRCPLVVLYESVGITTASIALSQCMYGASILVVWSSVERSQLELARVRAPKPAALPRESCVRCSVPFALNLDARYINHTSPGIPLRVSSLTCTW